MTRELVASEVAARLAELAALYVPEHIDEARRRFERERPTVAEPLAPEVARRLEELRALCELAEFLHGAAGARRRDGAGSGSPGAGYCARPPDAPAGHPVP